MARIDATAQSQAARRDRALRHASAGSDSRNPMIANVLIPRAEHGIVDASAEAAVQREVGR